MFIAIKTLFQIFFQFLKIPLLFIIIVVAIYVISCICQFRLQIKSGRKLPSHSMRMYKKESLFSKLFISAPKQFIDDIFSKEEDFFPKQGCIIFTGRQGYGKTIALIQYIMELQNMYPKVKVITNLNYKKEDKNLMHWKQLINYKNGKQGVIVGIDETQNWFSSSQSKNFPPEMLGVITQNRKNRRLMLGTSQNFYLLAKALRSQATEVRSCITILGVITIIMKREPFLDSEGNVKKWKHRGIYLFAHNKEIRESYNTYKVIESLSRSGFVDKANLKIE